MDPGNCFKRSAEVVPLQLVRLQLVEKLSAELEAANGALEDRNLETQQTLSQLRDAQDKLVAHQKLREMIELASGVAHEIRNPPNFVANFCDGSSSCKPSMN